MPIGDLNIARPLYSTAAASKETKGLGNRVFHDTTTTTKEKKKWKSISLPHSSASWAESASVDFVETFSTRKRKTRSDLFYLLLSIFYIKISSSSFMKERDVGANSIPLAASLRRPYLFGWQTQTSKWHTTTTTTTTSPSLHATLIRQMESNKKKKRKKSRCQKKGGNFF